MTLQSEEKESIIEYRIEKAYKSFQEAEQNCELGNWSLTANRLYYASFYMALALNLSAGESSRTHVGTFSSRGERIVIQNGKVDRTIGRYV